MAYTTQTQPLFFGVIASMKTAFEDYKVAAEKRRNFKKTVRELSELTNRELADLGLSRAMIKGVAYEAAYKN